MAYSLFFAVLMLCSRGAAEVFFPKSIAYLVSVLGFSVGLLFYYTARSPYFSFKPIVLLVSLAFLSASIASLLVSLASGLDVSYSYYFIYPLVVSLSFLIFFSVKLFNYNSVEITGSISLVVVLLFVVAIFQQFRLIELPGATPAYGISEHLVRPSSLTGSYLHYPLVMVLLGVVLHSAHKRLNIYSLLAFSSAFISFSRSGMMLVIIYFSYVSAANFLSSHVRLNLRKIIFYTFIAIAFLVALGGVGFLDLVADRLFSSFNKEAVGNNERINAWLRGLEVVANSNFLFGSNFGAATNLTSNLVGADSYVVESGVIQNLINFGALGTILFYSFFAIMFFSSKDVFFRAFFFAFFFQSFIYQSTEVLPFIIGSILFRALSLLTARSEKFHSFP